MGYPSSAHSLSFCYFLLEIRLYHTIVECFELLLGIDRPFVACLAERTKSLGIKVLPAFVTSDLPLIDVLSLNSRDGRALKNYSSPWQSFWPAVVLDHFALL
jgi:hypothetical protein